MKRLLSLLFVLCLVASLCGCGTAPAAVDPADLSAIHIPLPNPTILLARLTAVEAEPRVTLADDILRLVSENGALPFSLLSFSADSVLYTVQLESSVQLRLLSFTTQTYDIIAKADVSPLGLYAFSAWLYDDHILYIHRFGSYAEIEKSVCWYQDGKARLVLDAVSNPAIDYIQVIERAPDGRVLFLTGVGKDAYPLPELERYNYYYLDAQGVLRFWESADTWRFYSGGLSQMFYFRGNGTEETAQIVCRVNGYYTPPLRSSFHGYYVTSTDEQIFLTLNSSTDQTLYRLTARGFVPTPELDMLAGHDAVGNDNGDYIFYQSLNDTAYLWRPDSAEPPEPLALSSYLSNADMLLIFPYGDAFFICDSDYQQAVIFRP